MLHVEMKVPVKVKAGVGKQVQKLITLGHSHVVRVSRDYCHLVYFGGVFCEGHGIYSYSAGVLFLFSVIALVAGEDIE
jgi:hypothetical protein